MDKQAWIAITLSVVGLVVWQLHFAPKYVPTPAPAKVAGSPTPGASPAVISSKGEVVVDQKAAAPGAPSTETAPEQFETIHTAQIDLRFTNLGGGIAEAIPLGKQHITENGEDIKLNHAGLTAIGAISLQPGENARLPYAIRREGSKVICERTESDGLKIVKEYSLDYQGDEKQIPAIRLKITFSNTGSAALQKRRLLSIRRVRRAHPPARPARLHLFRLDDRRQLFHDARHRFRCQPRAGVGSRGP